MPTGGCESTTMAAGRKAHLAGDVMSIAVEAHEMLADLVDGRHVLHSPLDCKRVHKASSLYPPGVP